MPENKKVKNEPKEQRKPRQRQATENKNEKTIEKPIQKAPAKPEYVEPGPEFYKNLKRETDDIIKITQEVNAKYNKKEIQSNWTKYDIPIPSYENIDQEESMGEDYEKIIQMPMSTGGHFQFKHEKSWNSTTTPSEYDKYFDIDPEFMSLALCSIPFYERNNIDINLFSEYDKNGMRNRASKFKERYESSKLCNSEKPAEDNSLKVIEKDENKEGKENELNFRIFPKEEITNDINIVDTSQPEGIESNSKLDVLELEFKDNEFLLENKSEESQSVIKVTEDIKVLEIKTQEEPPKLEDLTETEKPEVHSTKKPTLQSPEDLEKWLDDFLEN